MAVASLTQAWQGALADRFRAVLTDHHGAVEVAFIGRAPPPEELFQGLATVQQAHTGVAVQAIAGANGVADALWSRAGTLPLAVVTADCVPILVAGEGFEAAIHAGWRGLCAGVIGRTLAACEEPAAGLRAWIGPAIGPCCYDVDSAVAIEVAAASSAAVICQGVSDKPRLDLVKSAEIQLQRSGLEEIRSYRRCTRCQPEWSSYRRDGRDSGRNLAIIGRSTFLPRHLGSPEGVDPVPEVARRRH